MSQCSDTRKTFLPHTAQCSSTNVPGICTLASPELLSYAQAPWEMVLLCLSQSTARGQVNRNLPLAQSSQKLPTETKPSESVHPGQSVLSGEAPPDVWLLVK